MERAKLVLGVSALKRELVEEYFSPVFPALETAENGLNRVKDAYAGLAISFQEDGGQADGPKNPFAAKISAAKSAYVSADRLLESLRTIRNALRFLPVDGFLAGLPKPEHERSKGGI